MRKFLALLPILFSFIFLVSCEPSRDENGDFLFGVNNPGGTGGGGTTVEKKLKSVTSTDDAGDVITYNYTYLADKLVQVTTSDNSFTYDLFYENNLITKMNILEDGGGILTTTNFTITYNNGKFVEANGTGTEDTGNKFTNKLTATYTNNKISKIVSKLVGIDSADPTILYDLFTYTSDLTYAGNNISTWKFTTSFPATPPIIFPPVVLDTAFSEYDAQKNPFNTLPEVYNIISSISGFEAAAVTGFSANNYRKVTVSTQADTQTATYTYTYDADGYPTKGVASNNLGTLSFTYIK